MKQQPHSIEKNKPSTFTFRALALGCKSNHYERDAVAQYLQAQGGEELFANAGADLIVLNTCAVTQEAERKARQTLRRARKEAPDALLVAMGCYSQLSDLGDLVDFAAGTGERMGIVRQALQRMRQQQIGDTSVDKHRVTSYEELGPVVRQAETRPQIKIADGCEEYCTYCTICLARGRVRSRSRENILEEARLLLAAGHRELVLTATHLAAFEQDKGRDSLALAELILELAQLPGLRRLRLGSLEPQSLTPAFVEAVAGVEVLCPHFHLSLQSGSDRILELMHRRYTVDAYLELVAALRQHFDRASITTDIMVGFPYETEADFKASCDLAEQVQFARIHVFRYSPRPHTKAAQYPQVPGDVKRERANRLQQLADRLAVSYARQFEGEEVSLIIEQPVSDQSRTYRGYTAHYLPAEMRFSPETVVHQGDLWLGQVTAVEQGMLQLKPIKKIV